jgi:hypothetical protein
MVLTKIFELMRDESTADCRRLHSDELHALFSKPNIIRKIKSRIMRWEGHVARTGDRRGAYRVLMGRSEGRKRIGIPWQR